MSKRKLVKERHIQDIYLNQVRSSERRKLGTIQYTKEELTNWCLAQPLYHILHADWVANNFLRELAPSVDRKDDYKPYSLCNIQLMTAKQNLDKGFADRAAGINTKMSTAVEQYTLDGSYVATFPSCNLAGRALGKINGSSISAVCSGKRGKAHGYIWKYATP